MAKLCPEGKAAAKRKFKVYPSLHMQIFGHPNIAKAKWVELKKLMVVLLLEDVVRL